MFGKKQCKYCYHKKIEEDPDCECRCHEAEIEAYAATAFFSGGLKK